MKASTEHRAVELDSTQFRNACGAFATGVTVITARDSEGDHGMTANAFMPVSLAPPLLAIAVAGSARIRPMIEHSGRFAVSVLATEGELQALHFGGQPQRAVREPFVELDGLPVIAGAAAAFATAVTQRLAVGDHLLFIGRVSALDADHERRPLAYHKGRLGTVEPQPMPKLDPHRMLEGHHW